jgi:hypothetical protein
MWIIQNFYTGRSRGRRSSEMIDGCNQASKYSEEEISSRDREQESEFPRSYQLNSTCFTGCGKVPV